jgi:hypothetical protein
LTGSDFGLERRATFERAIEAAIMGIDGTWCRGCTMADISENGGSLTVGETLADLNLKEFFLVPLLMAQTTVAAALEWINGSHIGAQICGADGGCKEKIHP